MKKGSLSAIDTGQISGKKGRGKTSKTRDDKGPGAPEGPHRHQGTPSRSGREKGPRGKEVLDRGKKRSSRPRKPRSRKSSRRSREEKKNPHRGKAFLRRAGEAGPAARESRGSGFRQDRGDEKKRNSRKRKRPSFRKKPPSRKRRRTSRKRAETAAKKEEQIEKKKEEIREERREISKDQQEVLNKEGSAVVGIPFVKAGRFRQGKTRPRQPEDRRSRVSSSPEPDLAGERLRAVRKRPGRRLEPGRGEPSRGSGRENA